MGNNNFNEEVEERRKLPWLKYLICFLIAGVIMVIVFAIRGFFTDNLRENLTILSDATFIAGAVFTLAAGILFVSGHGGLLGIGFVFSRVVKAFIPMGRDAETYKEYRERKLKKNKKVGVGCILFTGLFFLVASVILIIIWYKV